MLTKRITDKVSTQRRLVFLPCFHKLQAKSKFWRHQQRHVLGYQQPIGVRCIQDMFFLSSTYYVSFFFFFFSRRVRYPARKKNISHPLLWFPVKWLRISLSSIRAKKDQTHILESIGFCNQPCPCFLVYLLSKPSQIFCRREDKATTAFYCHSFIPIS